MKKQITNDEELREALEELKNFDFENAWKGPVYVQWQALTDRIIKYAMDVYIDPIKFIRKELKENEVFERIKRVEYGLSGRELFKEIDYSLRKVNKMITVEALKTILSPRSQYHRKGITDNRLTYHPKLIHIFIEEIQEKDD